MIAAQHRHSIGDLFSTAAPPQHAESLVFPPPRPRPPPPYFRWSVCCTLQARCPLKTFLKRFVARQYGLKSLALQQLSALKASLLRYAPTSARCRVFGWLIGVFTDEMPTGMFDSTSGTTASGIGGGLHISRPRRRNDAQIPSIRWFYVVACANT